MRPASGRVLKVNNGLASPSQTSKSRAARRRRLGAGVTALAIAAAGASSAQAANTGKWEDAPDLGVVGINAALLPDGRVLAYDSVGDAPTETFADQSTTRAVVYDPATGAKTPVNLTSGNIFASGLAHLPDGSVFTAGGNRDQALHGSNHTNVFGRVSLGWTAGLPLQADRWYPTVTALANGRMLVTSGTGRAGDAGDITQPEIREPNGAITPLTGAKAPLPQYPWMDLAPNGRVYFTGPWAGLRSFGTAGAGDTDTAGNRDNDLDRYYGSHAMYDTGKVLIAGGGFDADDPATPAVEEQASEKAKIVNLNVAQPQDAVEVTATGSMSSKRKQLNLTVLADGSVLATGGNSTGEDLYVPGAGVLPAERWNPSTGAWSTLASMSHTRQYQSSALLLPDGRVLSVGGGLCGVCSAVSGGPDIADKSAEIFTPPYLLKDDGVTPATRPTITSAPKVALPGDTLAIATPDKAKIAKAALIRLGATSHGNNMDQRYVKLTGLAQTGTGVSAKIPANVNEVPIGVYMLVVVDDQGVPSVAKMVRVGTNAAPTVALSAPAAATRVTAGSPLTVSATAADTDGSIAKVEFFAGDAKIGEDTTAPYSVTTATLAAGDYALRAVATDDLDGTTSSATRALTVDPAPVTPPGTGGGTTPPVETPPVQNPPVQNPPVQNPPVQTPPVQTPPTGGGNSKSPLALTKLALVVKGKARSVRFTASTSGKVTVSLSVARAKRLVAVGKAKSVSVKKGVVTVSLASGARLKPGRYTATVRYGAKTLKVTFRVR